MSANFIYDLDRIEYKNSASVTIKAGDIVKIGVIHGVAITDIPQNETGIVKVTGCFDVTAAKVATFVPGDIVYYDATIGEAVADNSKAVLGFAIAEKKSSSTTVSVALMPNIEKDAVK